MADQINLKQTASIIDSELAILRSSLLEKFHENMGRYGIVVTGNLKNNLRIDSDKIADDMVGGIEIMVEKYGLLLQARRKFVVKAPIAEIIDWVKQIGISRFSNNGQVPTEDKDLIRIAWGIKQHGRLRKLGSNSIISNKNQKRISDPWFHREFYGQVSSFQKRLAEKIPAPFAADIANALKRQLNNK